MARTCTEVVWSLNGPSQKTVATVTEMTEIDMAVTEDEVTGVEESSATSVVNGVILPEIAAVGVDRAGTVLIETEAVIEAVIVGEQEAEIDVARAVILDVLATQGVHLEESTQDILSVTVAHH